MRDHFRRIRWNQTRKIEKSIISYDAYEIVPPCNWATKCTENTRIYAKVYASFTPWEAAAVSLDQSWHVSHFPNCTTLKLLPLGSEIDETIQREKPYSSTFEVPFIGTSTKRYYIYSPKYVIWNWKWMIDNGNCCWFRLQKQEHDQPTTDAAGKRGNMFDSILLRAIIFFRTKNTYGLGKAVLEEHRSDTIFAQLF